MENRNAGKIIGIIIGLVFSATIFCIASTDWRAYFAVDDACFEDCKYSRTHILEAAVLNLSDVLGGYPYKWLPLVYTLLITTGGSIGTLIDRKRSVGQ